MFRNDIFDVYKRYEEEQNFKAEYFLIHVFLINKMPLVSNATNYSEL